MENKQSTSDEAKFDAAYNDKLPSFELSVNIAVVGKVSAGKSSIINAILERDRNNKIADVGAISGITTKVTQYPFDKDVLIIDCPGLDDVRSENSDVTKQFLGSIDFGIFVVHGSSDATQKANYLDLKNSAKKTIVVLNKIDDFDKLNKKAYEEVVSQWKVALGINEIFGTCAYGYDPESREDAPMDLRGVDIVREEIIDFLKTQKKDILFARHLKNKRKYAVGIIVASLAAVAAEAFIPGSTLYITATQASAITSLQYLYTGEVLKKSTALALLPTFIGQSLGMNAFLWIKSLLPPTGILDVAAAGVAVIITFAMLASVVWVFENNHSLDDEEYLKSTFAKFKTIGNTLTMNDIKSTENLKKLINGWIFPKA